jgi:hypothetical protein
MQNQVNMDIINKVFKDHKGKKIFVATKEHNKNSTKENKAPYDVKKNCFLTWSDEEKLMDLDELNKWIPEFHPGCGFITGITTNDSKGSPYPSIQCLDFDDVLKDGEPKNPKIDDLLNRLDTYTEISASGKGLHAVILSDYKGPEWGFDDKTFCKGKYYSKDHFIKLTGIVYKNFNKGIEYINERNVRILKERIGNVVDLPKVSTQTNFSGPFKSWRKILDDSGIPYTDTTYTNQVRVYENNSVKLCVESVKIECPNTENHTQLSNPYESAHKAILCLWEDGTSSLTCNHNACSPDKKPNLLQMLWDQIHYKENYKKLKMAGWIK